MIGRRDLLACTLALLVARPASAAGPDPATALPADPDAAVIVFAYRGGFRPADMTDPVLTIRADGRVEADTPRERGRSARLSPSELADLVDYLVVGERFFEIDAGAIEAGMEAEKQATGQGVAVADAATTEVTVVLPGRSHTVSVYGVQALAPFYQTVEPLQRLARIERRLSDILYPER